MLIVHFCPATISSLDLISSSSYFKGKTLLLLRYIAPLSSEILIEEEKFPEASPIDISFTNGCPFIFTLFESSRKDPLSLNVEEI